MKFEYLPNEIFIECFEYLNGSDIFYSFDQLNYRLNDLIRTIRLYINFQNIRKIIFDDFCQKMLLYPNMQKQIYSLILSNKPTHGQIEEFLTYFSLDKFSHLQSLTLIDIKQNNIKHLKSTLPLLSQLLSLHLLDSKGVAEELISIFSFSKLKTLSAILYPTLSIHEIIPIVNLTISSFTLNQLCQLLQYTPMLEYLNISNIRRRSYSYKQHHEICSNNHYILHLKHLIMINSECDLNDLQSFFKHIPNLKTLILSTYNNFDIMNAYQWEQLIISTFKYLKNFQFKFGIYDENQSKTILEKYQEFQNDFWHKEHHWYTECIISSYSAFIYTIPYLIDSTLFSLESIKYSNKSINHFNTFNNITILNLSDKEFREECVYYFPNILSLNITSLPMISNENDEENFMKTLKKIVNLSNIKHLNIPITNSTNISSVLLKIIQETPYLSSLSIDICIFESLLMNYDLCNYLNKMIKNLELRNLNHRYQHPYLINSFNEIFLNIEQLSCKIEGIDEILFLFKKFSKLSILEGYYEFTTNKQYVDFRNQLLKFNEFFYECIKSHMQTSTFIFGIWTDVNSMN